MKWLCAGRQLDLSEPLIMGIVNVTPDSFSDGGRYAGTPEAIAHGLELLEQGADILDIGGESTRPGAAEVTEQEELERVIPVVEALAKTGAVISVDTSKAEVMRAALSAGASILNDVRAFEEEGALQAAANSSAGLVIMHMHGTPNTGFGWMQDEKTPKKLFDISKAERAIDITSNTERDSVMLVDIENMQVIWMDRAVLDRGMKDMLRGNTNISCAIPDSVEAYRAIHNTVPELYDLINLHAEARGSEIVNDPKEADAIFTLNRVDPKDYPDTKEFLCAFDADKILGDLVPDELNNKDKEYFEKEREEEEKEKEKEDREEDEER